MFNRIAKVTQLLLIVGLLATVLTVNQVAAQTDSRFFPQTNHTVRGAFLQYWNTHGALAQQGYPITDEYPEVNSIDGNTYTTQYFERARFEFHPEQSDPNFKVLLGLLGVEALQAKYPSGLPAGTQEQVVPGGGSFNFPNTGFTVTGLFLSYWNTHGGLAQQGYPITPAYQELNEADGKIYVTQYFERARFEYHPEQTDPQYRVLLGLVGNEIYQRKQGGSSPTATPAAAQPTATTSQPTATSTTAPSAPTSTMVPPTATTAPVPPTATPTPASAPHNVTQVLQQATIAANGTGSATAACPSGSFVTGGGWASSTNLDVYNSSKSGNGWQVFATNTSGSGQLLNAYAVCMTGLGIAPVQELVQVTVGAGQHSGGSKVCSSGYLTGGGFAKNTGEHIYNSSPQGNGWTAYAFNNTGASKLLNIYAMCFGGIMDSSIELVQVNVTANGTGHATVACPANRLATGGGFAGNDNLVAYTTDRSGNGWEVYAKNNSAATQLLNAYAVCVTLP